MLKTRTHSDSHILLTGRKTRSGKCQQFDNWHFVRLQPTPCFAPVTLCYFAIWRSFDHNVMADERRGTDISPDLLFDSDSESEVFEGFEARDIRHLAGTASKAPLFSSTPKAKRVRVETGDVHEFTWDSDSSISLDEECDLEHQTKNRTSSESSVEGEISHNVLSCDQSGCSFAENSEKVEEESSSSVEGEVSHSKEQFLAEEETEETLPAEDQPLHAGDDRGKTVPPKVVTKRRGKAEN